MLARGIQPRTVPLPVTASSAAAGSAASYGSGKFVPAGSLCSPSFQTLAPDFVSRFYTSDCDRRHRWSPFRFELAGCGGTTFTAVRNRAGSMPPGSSMRGCPRWLRTGAILKVPFSAVSESESESRSDRKQRKLICENSISTGSGFRLIV